MDHRCEYCQGGSKGPCTCKDAGQQPQPNESALMPLLDAASPLPWRIDKDNSEGIEVVDAHGELVYCEDYGCFPDEMSNSQIDRIIEKMRANAHLMVEWSKSEQQSVGSSAEKTFTIVRRSTENPEKLIVTYCTVDEHNTIDGALAIFGYNRRDVIIFKGRAERLLDGE